MRRLHFWSQIFHTSPSDGIKNCLREAKTKPVFKVISRLQKVTSIGKFLGWTSIFMESWTSDPVFGKNPVFVVHVREQPQWFRTNPPPDSDSSWSKVPPIIWNLVFLYLKYTMCASPIGNSMVSAPPLPHPFRHVVYIVGQDMSSCEAFTPAKLSTCALTVMTSPVPACRYLLDSLTKPSTRASSHVDNYLILLQSLRHAHALVRM